MEVVGAPRLMPAYGWLYVLALVSIGLEAGTKAAVDMSSIPASRSRY